MRTRAKTITALGLIIGLTVSSTVFSFAANALPNGTITEKDGKKYLMDSQGIPYSGWFIDSIKDWYYFNESDKTIKTGWYEDSTDQFTYYFDTYSGKMQTGWQTIDGKEYFFQPVRDMENYHFNSDEEKWLYSSNGKIPYGALYMNTITPDGSMVDENGAKIVETANTIQQGWLSENGNWYYILSDGTRFSNGWKEIGGKLYYFGSDGILYVNTTTPDGSQVDGNGVKIVETVNTIRQGWYSENGSWYYILSDGTKFSNGWKEIDGKSYYFGSDGVLYVNTTTPDGSQVDENGVKSDRFYITGNNNTV